MIQRKQSIFIGLTIVFSFLLFLLPVSVYTIDNVNVNLNSNPFQQLEPTGWAYLVLVFNVSFFLLSILALFSFKNRKKQIKLCGYTIISSILLLIGFLAFPLVQSNSAEKHLSWSICLIPISIIFLLIAIRLIKQDEELVRSADRIR